MPVNHDVAWTLWLAQEVLSGRELYRDLFEMNPPLIVWLNLPIVLIAKSLGLSVYLCFLAAASLLLGSAGLLAVQSLQVERMRAGVILALVLGPLAVADFGQRDHLCFALLLPLVALAIRRRAGGQVASAPAIAIGVMAGVAVALKPFLAPVWLLLLPYRRPAVEDAAILGVGALYCGAVILWVPEYLELLGALHDTYTAFNRQRWVTMLTHPSSVTLLAVGVLWAHLRRKGTMGPQVSACLLAACGAWVSAVTQRKGWNYHWYPATAFTLLTVAAMYRAVRAGVYFDHRTQAASARRATNYLLAGAILLFGYYLITGAEALYARRASIELLRVASRPNDRVLVLSSRVADAWPAVPLVGARWAARVPSMWFAQAGGLQGPSTMSAGERLLFTSLVDDLLAQPEWLIVESPELNALRLQRPGLDALAYLSQDPRTAAVLQRYRKAGLIDGMSVWERK